MGHNQSKSSSALGSSDPSRRRHHHAPPTSKTGAQTSSTLAPTQEIQVNAISSSSSGYNSSNLSLASSNEQHHSKDVKANKKKRKKKRLSRRRTFQITSPIPLARTDNNGKVTDVERVLPNIASLRFGVNEEDAKRNNKRVEDKGKNVDPKNHELHKLQNSTHSLSSNSSGRSWGVHRSGGRHGVTRKVVTSKGTIKKKKIVKGLTRYSIGVLRTRPKHGDETKGFARDSSMQRHSLPAQIHLNDKGPNWETTVTILSPRHNGTMRLDKFPCKTKGCVMADYVDRNTATTKGDKQPHAALLMLNNLQQHYVAANDSDEHGRKRQIVERDQSRSSDEITAELRNNRRACGSEDSGDIRQRTCVGGLRDGMQDQQETTHHALTPMPNEHDNYYPAGYRQCSEATSPTSSDVVDDLDEYDREEEKLLLLAQTDSIPADYLDSIDETSVYASDSHVERPSILDEYLMTKRHFKNQHDRKSIESCTSWQSTTSTLPVSMARPRLSKAMPNNRSSYPIGVTALRKNSTPSKKKLSLPHSLKLIANADVETTTNGSDDVTAPFTPIYEEQSVILEVDSGPRPTKLMLDSEPRQLYSPEELVDSPQSSRRQSYESATDKRQEQHEPEICDQTCGGGELDMLPLQEALIINKKSDSQFRVDPQIKDIMQTKQITHQPHLTDRIRPQVKLADQTLSKGNNAEFLTFKLHSRPPSRKAESEVQKKGTDADGVYRANDVSGFNEATDGYSPRIAAPKGAAFGVRLRPVSRKPKWIADAIPFCDRKGVNETQTTDVSLKVTARTPAPSAQVASSASEEKKKASESRLLVVSEAKEENVSAQAMPNHSIHASSMHMGSRRMTTPTKHTTSNSTSDTFSLNKVPINRSSGKVTQKERVARKTPPRKWATPRGKAGLVLQRITEIDGELRRTRSVKLKTPRRETAGDGVLAPRKATLLNPLFRGTGENAKLDIVSVITAAAKESQMGNAKGQAASTLSSDENGGRLSTIVDREDSDDDLIVPLTPSEDIKNPTDTKRDGSFIQVMEHTAQEKTDVHAVHCELGHNVSTEIMHYASREGSRKSMRQDEADLDCSEDAATYTVESCAQFRTVELDEEINDDRSLDDSFDEKSESTALGECESPPFSETEHSSDSDAVRCNSGEKIRDPFAHLLDASSSFPEETISIGKIGSGKENHHLEEESPGKVLDFSENLESSNKNDLEYANVDVSESEFISEPYRSAQLEESLSPLFEMPILARENVDNAQDHIVGQKASVVPSKMALPGSPKALCLSPTQRTPHQARKWRTLAAEAAAKDASKGGSKGGKVRKDKCRKLLLN